ncbi:MAG: universal stress protein [Pirellulaceae bacterium]|nr:universal stress protein [Pirellulaceae bacterium]
MKVLVGVDGSTGSWAAAALASRLLTPASDQLLLYNSPPTLYARGSQRPSSEELDQARTALAEAVFAKAADQLDSSWEAHFQTICGKQKPAHGLLVAAEEVRAEMLVVGARGIGPLESLHVGSVSRAVAQHANIPVLVVRPRPDSHSHPLRVLMTCDGTEASAAAADVLHRLHWPAGSVGLTLNVVESRIVGQVPTWLEQQARDSQTDLLAKAWVEEHDRQLQTHRDQLQQFCQERLPAIFRQSSPLVRDGHPAQQILQVIHDQRIDLVVCGARNQSAWRQLLMGSTSQHVLSHAPCSVLIVRQHEQP